MDDITSELRNTEYVSDFLSGGPKNYTYKKVDSVTGRTDTICKVRGITPNYSAKQMVNFDVIMEMVLGTSAETTVTVNREKKIKRKKICEGGSVAIVTEPKDKTYRISFFKRRQFIGPVRV